MLPYTNSYVNLSDFFVDAGANTTFPPSPPSSFSENIILIDPFTPPFPPETLFFENSILIDIFTPPPPPTPTPPETLFYENSILIDIFSPLSPSETLSSENSIDTSTPPETEDSILIDTFTPNFTDDPFIHRPAPGPLDLKEAEQPKLQERRKSRYVSPLTPRKDLPVSGPPPLEYKSAKAKASAARFGDITRESLQELADIWSLKMAAAAFY